MTEVYKVGITIALTNKVSSALSLIRGDLAKTDAAALRLKSTLREIKLLGIGGAILGGAGFMGLKALGAALKPAEQYAHQLNIMNMAGMKQADIAESIALAWKTSRDIMTTAPTENLRSILDLKNITGSLNEAKQLLPIVSKIQAVMAASSEGRVAGHAQEIAFSMGKALDIIGAVRDPAELLKQAAMMSKVVAATQNRVTPQMFQGVFQYARQGKFDMSDEFKYEILPSLMLEASSGKGGGGGSKGVGPMIAAMYRITNQGYVNKKSFAEWKKLGLMSAGSELRTTTAGTTAGPVKNSQLAASNSFEWVNSVLVPSIRAKYGQGVSDQFVRQEINQLMRGNQLAASLAVEEFTKQQNFLRDQKIIRGAMDYQGAFDAAMKNDPATARAAAAKQWEALETLIGLRIIPILIPALHKLADGLGALTAWSQRNPGALSGLVYGFTALSGLALAGGSIMILTAGIKAVGLLVKFATPLSVMAGLPLAGMASGLTLLTAALVPLAAFAYHKEIANAIDSHAPAVGDFMLKARDFLRSDYSPGFAPPPSGKSTTVHTQVNLDGRQIATVVSQHQASANGPASSSSAFDARQGFTQPGYTGAW